MKKVLLFLGLAVMTFSCQVNDNVSIPTESTVNNKEVLSKIDELEAQGVKLFKKDVAVTDLSGENKITLQVAFTDEKQLNEYMNNTQFTLQVFKSLSDLPSRQSSNPDMAVPEKSIKSGGELYEVVTAKDFVQGTVAYSLSHKVKMTSGKNKGAKLSSGYANGTWVESYVRDNFMDVTWKASGNTDEGLYVECFYTNCGVCGWKTDPQTKHLFATDPFFHYSHTDARRLAVRVNHNYYNYTVFWGTE